jgi:glucose/arabinose dehydrogenase
MRCYRLQFLRALIVLLGLVAGSTMLPGQSNEFVVFGFTNTWRYNQSGSYDGIPWQQPGFNDAGLPSGRGLLAFESNNTFVTSRTNTVLALGPLTYYFRTKFVFSNAIAGTTLVFSNIVDDGAAFYLNGVPIHRLYLPEPPAELRYDTPATTHEVTGFDVFSLSGPVVETNLVVGTNVLAVEVHQQDSSSRDIVFGTALSAIVADTNPPPSLTMPQNPPSYGYKFVNAFGNLSFEDPVAIVTPPGETNRVFVLEQAGRIVAITNLAAPNRTVFLDISSRIVSGGEMGLLGLAFHPGYASNRQFYVYYTVNTSSAQRNNALHDRLSCFRASALNPNLADPTSELILLEQYDEADNHNAGDLHFGPDGYLYLSLGDEGAGNDFYGNSQRIDKDFFAGLLRLDVDNRPESLPANPHPANTNNPAREIRYRVPPDNPWVNATNFNLAAVNPALVRTEFYAVGLRNPWRFSFDPFTGELYLADVGQDAYEEVDLIRRGGNYGWNYREALHIGPRLGPPLGIVFDQPIVEYVHGGNADQGNSVTGGVVYRGNRLPSLYGAYVFADYLSGNVWMLRANGTNVVPFTRLTVEANIAGFGVDPRNDDILIADQGEDTIKRLVEDTGVMTGRTLPPTLFHTGAFTNLHSLTAETEPLIPNTGVQPYEINVPFWSDNARKSRWFYQPNPALAFGFNASGNWSFPTGTVWVKHFDLELTNGVPASAKRLETRLLVRNANGVYGATYRWTSVTNAWLVPETGTNEEFAIYDQNGLVRTQVWHYPGRSECLTCHNSKAGFALGFSTAQLNRDVERDGSMTNQISALLKAGYLRGPLPSLNLLPALAPATNEAWSREWRVRSYLAANCSQCHQPGGYALGFWDARLSNPLSAAGLVQGRLVNDAGDSQNRVIVPNAPEHSMLLARISRQGPGRMPPLATSLLDTQAVALVNEWITNDLAAYHTFPEWQTLHFGDTNAPGAAFSDDPDSDGALNLLEWLTGTDPVSPTERWGISVALNEGTLRVLVPQIAGRGFEVQAAPGFEGPWQPLDLPSNRPFFTSSNQLMVIEEPATNALGRFYRVRVFEP